MVQKKITIFHSPDADDAFMFYGLSSGAVTHADYTFEHELCDIESLNQRALKGEIDCSAASVHAMAYLAKNYYVLRCGASMGGQSYGPRLISKMEGEGSFAALKRIAVPGPYTSATLALRLFLNEQGCTPELINMNFDRVTEAVQAGEVDAGVIIHEGQLTYEREGLFCLADLGRWWWNKHQLPLPLGVNIVKKELGLDTAKIVSQTLKSSIQYSLDNREKALSYALGYGRGLSRSDADEFVGMYVNDWTLELGEAGIRSINLFLNSAAELGFAPACQIEFV